MKKIIAIFALIVMIAVVGTASFFAWKSLGRATSSAGPQIPVKITIEKGMTATEIGNMLQDEKVIENALVFKYVVRKEGVGADFKPGVYNLKTSMDYEAVIEKLTQGPPVKYITLTIPEGWTAKQITERLAANTKIDANEYMNLVTQGQVVIEYPFLKNNGAPTKNLEGYLYPETFKLQEDITAEKFLHIQLSQFEKATESLNWANTQTLGRTSYEIIVIASLIERETRVDDERPLVASVIYNRLRKDMPLQIDATVQYALPEWKDKLMLEDLKVESPYNTYKNQGLPPGPICNPSASSIAAALEPATTEYLYYVLSGDNTGRHVFTNTYNEFLNAKAKYKSSLQ